MTAREFERVVRRWQKLLGLEHWSICVRVGVRDHGAGADDDVFARIYRHERYDDAVLEVAEWAVGQDDPPDRIEAALLDDELVERKAVHELLHLTTRDMATVVEQDLDGYLHRDAADMLAKSWERAEERAVDGLARHLVRNFPQRRSV